eukprot:TRINITY_DN2429_c0_g1_i2.p2 TRINITY_DN2429_c0_g1~~TRINITY_DN2429_c0_g1_i2.p2  ORF type:complete len:250 (-),score=73.78 TRINITY_DN2429_c0_g1_i2:1407-2156(-)
MSRKPSIQHSTTRASGGFSTKIDRNIKAEDYEEEEDDEVMQNAYSIHKESTASTVRSIQKLEEAKEIGTKAAADLKVQSEQMDRIEGDVEEVHHNLDIAKPLIKGINSMFSAVANGITGIFTPGSKSSSAPVDAGTSSRKQSTSAGSSRQTPTKSKAESQTTKHDYESDDDRYEKMVGSKGNRLDVETKKQSQNLEQISHLLTDLKGLAQDMNTELDMQSEKIDRITNRVDDASVKMAETNAMAKKAAK